jgi:hypothetical protein
MLNKLVTQYQSDTSNGELFEYIKSHLPEGFLQKATYTMSYETALSIYFGRRKHRLSVWHEFCNWIFWLPLMKKFVMAAEGKGAS